MYQGLRMKAKNKDDYVSGSAESSTNYLIESGIIPDDE